jgi:hypothetical protein
LGVASREPPIGSQKITKEKISALASFENIIVRKCLCCLYFYSRKRQKGKETARHPRRQAGRGKRTDDN